MLDFYPSRNLFVLARPGVWTIVATVGDDFHPVTVDGIPVDEYLDGEES